MQILGERLKALREGMKLSQQKVADMIGCPQTSIYRYENGTYTPSAEALLWYADYFDVSMDYIFGRTDKPQGKLYKYEPQALKITEERRREMADFVAMCFDPKSKASTKIKALMLQMMEENDGT